MALGDIDQYKLNPLYLNLKKYNLESFKNTIDYKKSVPIQIFDIIDFVVKLSTNFDDIRKIDPPILLKSEIRETKTMSHYYTPKKYTPLPFFFLKLDLIKYFNKILIHHKITQKDYDQFNRRYKKNTTFRTFIYVIIVCSKTNYPYDLNLKSFTNFIIQNNQLLLNCLPCTSDISCIMYNYENIEYIFDINLLKYKYIFYNTIKKENVGIINYIIYLYYYNDKKLTSLYNLICNDHNLFNIVIEKLQYLQLYDTSPYNGSINTADRRRICLNTLNYIYKSLHTN